jgi:hypothetical protein
MSDRRRLRATLRHPLPPEDHRRGDAARVLPLGGVASLAISADVVRARLGAWAGLRAPDERPDLDTAWREVLLVLGALVEAGDAALGADAAPAWERAVPIPREPLDLQQRAALSGDAVRRAVDRAISAELLDLQSRVGDELVVRLRPEVFADAPVVAAVDWVAVRRALGLQVSPVALLLVREIARRTTPERRAQGDVVPISLREFGAATGASKGTIQKALGVLQTAGLLESRIRDRVDSWHRLLPAAFGESPITWTAAPRAEQTSVAPGLGAGSTRPSSPPQRPDSSLRAGAPHAELRASPDTRVAATSAAPGELAGAVAGFLSGAAGGAASRAEPGLAAGAGGGLVAPVATGDPVTVYEVDGMAWPLPAGVRPRLEQGADGSPMRRIGNVRIPLRRLDDPQGFPVVEIDGVLWELLPGMQPQLERDPDGRYWYRMGGERWPFRPH